MYTLLNANVLSKIYTMEMPLSNMGPIQYKDDILPV